MVWYIWARKFHFATVVSFVPQSVDHLCFLIVFLGAMKHQKCLLWVRRQNSVRAQVKWICSYEGCTTGYCPSFCIICVSTEWGVGTFMAYLLISPPQFWRSVTCSLARGIQAVLWLQPRTGPKALSSHWMYLSARWEKLISKARSICTKETCHILQGSYFPDGYRKLKSKEGENLFSLMG